MAFVETLRLVLDADLRGGVAQVERFGKTAQREGLRAEQSLTKVGHAMTNVGAGMVAVGVTALFGLGKMAQASEEANLSVVKLENTIANMPALAGESSKQFTDLAESIQDVTAADADQIVAAEAMLGTFRLTADEIKGIIPLVVDYSRKFGIDMVSASTQVGKALDGNIGALKRAGVSIDETLFATDRYAAVQQALSDQVGGFAEAEGQTFAGSLQRLKNELGDLAEGVGSGAVDAFTTMFGVVDSLTGKLNEMSPATQNTIGKVATYGSVALVAAGGTSFLIGQVITARQRFAEAASAIANAGSTLLGFKANALTAGIGLGVIFAGLEAIDRLLPIDTANLSELENALLGLGRSGDITGELADAMGEDLGKLKDALSELADPSTAQAATHALDEVLTVGGVLPGGTRNLDEARQAIDDIDKALTRLAQRDPEEAAAALDALIEGMNLSRSDTEEFRSLLDDYNSTLAEVDTSQRTAGASASEASAGVDEFGEALDADAEAAQRAEEAVNNYANALRSMVDPLFGMQDAMRGNVEAAAELRLRQDELAAAVRDYGADSDEAREAQEAYTDAQIGARDAAVDLWGAALTLQAAVENDGLSADMARRQFVSMATQMGYTAAEAEQMAGDFGFAASEARRLGSSDPTVVLTTVGYQQTLTNIGNVRAAISSMPRSIAIEVNFHATGTNVLRRQHGGDVRAFEMYRVGEAGEELFMSDTPGRIVPHHQIGQYMNMASAHSYASGGGWSGGGTQVIEPHFHFHGPIASQPDAERWVAQAWNRAYERNLVNARGRRL